MQSKQNTQTDEPKLYALKDGDTVLSREDAEKIRDALLKARMNRSALAGVVRALINQFESENLPYGTSEALRKIGVL